MLNLILHKLKYNYEKYDIKKMDKGISSQIYLTQTLVFADKFFIIICIKLDKNCVSIDL